MEASRVEAKGSGEMLVDFKYKPEERVIAHCLNGNKYNAEIHKCIYDCNGIYYEIIVFANQENKLSPSMRIVPEGLLSKGDDVNVSS